MRTWVLGLFLFASLAQAAPIRIGLVLDKGGKDDKSFNAAAYAGALQAQKELGAELKFVEASDDNAIESLLKKFAEKKFDIIVGVGIAQKDAMTKVATQFPNQKFAVVDADVSAPNVRSLLFQEHEGSYLVGAIAALSSKTGKVGFVGGMEIPLIRRFQMGYEAGARKVNPKIQVVSNYVGVTSDAWNNPPQGKSLALSQFNTGADVVFTAAGASGLGVFDAAEEKKKFAIGVDSNQNWIKPGTILTSMMKRVDVAVYNACKDVAESKFTGGAARFGLSNSGVDYALDGFNEKLLPKNILAEVNGLKKKIITGEIKVPDYYLTSKK